MKKNPAIFVFVFMFICAVLLAYAINCGIYCVKGYFEQKELEKQEQIRIEKLKQEQAEKIRRERIEKQRRARAERQQKASETAERESNRIHIPFNNPSKLSYKSKEEIYELRKDYVSKSVFANPDYEPSEAVFGQIESNKPWNSMKQCIYRSTNLSDIDGISEEGRYINNPELLVGVEYAFYGDYCEDRQSEELLYSRPLRITYDKEQKEIEVLFGGLPYCTYNGRTWYNFKGLNARDLGYKYAYIDKEKSTFDLYFVEEINASNSIIEFQDYIHVGGSCGHKGGCNNGSPNQPPLNFYSPCEIEKGYWAKNKTIYIKLWKNKPNSPQDEPDIVQKIVFQRAWQEKPRAKRERT